MSEMSASSWELSLIVRSFLIIVLSFQSADLVALNASEEDKIKAMMFQSNVDYDPAK